MGWGWGKVGEVLSEKVVKCLRLQNPGTGQVQGTMFGREQGVGPFLAARSGQVLIWLQTCGHAFPHFPQDEPFFGSLRVRAEVRTHLGVQLTFREMTSSLLITHVQSGFGNRSLLLRSYFNNVILRNILGELQPTSPQSFPSLLGDKMLYTKGIQVGLHALKAPSKAEMPGFCCPCFLYPTVQHLYQCFCTGLACPERKWN